MGCRQLRGRHQRSGSYSVPADSPICGGAGAATGCQHYLAPGHPPYTPLPVPTKGAAFFGRTQQGRGRGLGFQGLGLYRLADVARALPLENSDLRAQNKAVPRVELGDVLSAGHLTPRLPPHSAPQHAIANRTRYACSGRTGRRIVRTSTEQHFDLRRAACDGCAATLARVTFEWFNNSGAPEWKYLYDRC